MEQRGRRLRAWVVAIGVAAGAMLAGVGVAAAQTDGSTTTAPAVQAAPEAGMRGPGGPGGHHKAFGPGGIHGEFVTHKQGGGYQTMATQVGEVTAVSGSSVTVKSEDGYSKAYAINDDTMVSAGNDGTADVKIGDEVHVMAIKDGDTYRAVDVRDHTQGERIHGQFRPAKPSAPAADA